MEKCRVCVCVCVSVSVYIMNVENRGILSFGDLQGVSLFVGFNLGCEML